MPKTTATPLMKQYYDIRAKYPGIVLFFRLGDFYEMFDEQAREVSALLGLTLTARNGTPMCGIPYHAANNYIVRLLNAGKKIGICEQTSSVMDKNTKLFERKVTRVITPGTIMEDTLLDANQSNYLVALNIGEGGWALSCVEVSTGEFWVNQNDKDATLTNLAAALAVINPSEVIGDQETLSQLKNKVVLPGNLTLTEQPAYEGDYTLPESWPSLGAWGNKRKALACALQTMAYLNVTEPSFKTVLIPSYRELKECLQIDENAVSALELVKSQEGGRKGSLWALLDKTKTAVGSRKLKEWILHPLMDPGEISQRQDCVEGFVKNQAAIAELTALLENISDIERIGDYAENIVEYAQRMSEDQATFSDMAKAEIKAVDERIRALYQKIDFAFVKRDLSQYREIDEIEESIDKLTNDMSEAHLERMTKGECTPKSGAIYLQLSGNLERIADHLVNIANSVKTYHHTGEV